MFYVGCAASVTYLTITRSSILVGQHIHEDAYKVFEWSEMIKYNELQLIFDILIAKFRDKYDKLSEKRCS